MPGESTVVVHTPLGINFSFIRQLFPSLTFPSRKLSRRGDENLQRAEYYIQVTEEQLDVIYNASQEATNEFVQEITLIRDDFNDVNSILHAVKTARSSQSALSKRVYGLSSHGTTVDVLNAARELSEKALHTSNKVSAKDESSKTNTVSQTAPESSEYTGDELTAQTNVCGIDFSFNRKPTEEDTKKIESVIRLVGPQLYYDDDTKDESESESVRVLRSRKSDLSTYSFHYWGMEAYATRETRSPPDISEPGSFPPDKPSSECKTLTGMQLGAQAAFSQCHINILNIQSNDSSAVSNSASKLGSDGFAGQGLTDIYGSSCLSCASPRGTPAVVQTSSVPLQDAAIDATRSVSEQHSSATPSLQAQNNNPTMTMQSPRETHPRTQDAQPVDYDDSPPDTCISAIALSTEANTQLDDTTASFFTEAANFIASQLDSLPDGNPCAHEYEAEDMRTTAVPEGGSASNPSADDGVTSPTSPGSRLSEPSSLGSPSSRSGGNNYFIFQNSLVASRSAIQTPTLNSGGSHNQGSSTSR